MNFAHAYLYSRYITFFFKKPIRLSSVIYNDKARRYLLLFSHAQNKASIKGQALSTQYFLGHSALCLTTVRLSHKGGQSFSHGSKNHAYTYIKRALYSPFSTPCNHFFFRKMRDLAKLTEAARVTEAWEDYMQAKYGGNKSNKETTAFRDYENALQVQPTVAALYKENHEKQTLEHVLAMKEKYKRLDKAYLGIWEVLEKLNGLVDDSDPDIQMPQTIHALQSAEAARRDGQPRWMILTALIHDLGKYLYFMDEDQWNVSNDYMDKHITLLNSSTCD